MLETIKKFFHRENPYLELYGQLEPYNHLPAVAYCRLGLADGRLPPKGVMMITTTMLISATDCPRDVLDKMIILCREAK